MQRQFIFSSLPEVRENSIRNIEISAYYIHNILEQNGELDKYDSVTCSLPVRTTRDDFKKELLEIRKRFQEYLPLLAAAIQAHHKHHSYHFWERALWQGVHSFLLYTWETFSLCSQRFDPKQHCATILDTSECSPSKTFNELFYRLVHSEYGREELFAAYIQSQQLHCTTRHILRPELKPIGFNALPVASKNKFLQLAKKFRPHNVLRKVLCSRQPVLGIMETAISPANLERLCLHSLGKIQLIQPPNFPETSLSCVDTDTRKKIAASIPANDNFALFFAYCFEKFFPSIFIEQFDAMEHELCVWLKQYPKLKYIANEQRQVYDDSVLFLAYAKEQQGILHIYNEHNGLFHPFLCNDVLNNLAYTDFYLSHGWKDRTEQHFIPLGSLFPWQIQKMPPTNEALFISAPSMAIEYAFSGADSFSGSRNLIASERFTTTFLRRLPHDIITRIAHRPYPTRFLDYPRTVELESLLKLLQGTDKKKSGQDLIAVSKLVIIDYISTGFLECFVNNIPTVVLYDKSRVFLDDAYANYFDELEEVGIFQSDPQRAAKHICNIFTSPETWWFNEKTQKALQHFLNKSFGKPELLFNFFIGLTK